MTALSAPAEPERDCLKCPRLVAFRRANAKAYPDFFNGAVQSFGPADAALLVIGLAPGLKGANRTGRPFTGDFSGDLLYKCLGRIGWAKGTLGRTVEDGFTLVNTMVTNAVRCVPPENKPMAQEINSCRPFLVARLEALPNLKVMLALGKVAHDSTVRALGLRLADFPFGHAAVHRLPNGCSLVDSYHVSRYNVNTGRLTEAMFMAALMACRDAMAS